MLPVLLIPHPSTACPAVRGFEARARLTPEGALQLDYRVAGDIDRFSLPGPVPPRRADGLWRRTCLEAFLARPGHPGYLEFNFSPSGEWAAYRFAAYRAGMAEAGLAGAPAINVHRDAGRLELSAAINLAGLDCAGAALRLGLSAVLEEQGGRLSYWALAHPPGQPDFHHGDGFVLPLMPAAA
jgi:hypothetical protein